MNNLMEFHYDGRRVRTLTIDGEPWFVAADVCRVLEILNPSDALQRLEDDERTLVSIEGASNGKPVNAVSEPGLYALILGSRKPEAKAFKRWVTHEVLPSIRQHGMYATPDLLNDPDHLLKVTQRLVEEHHARLAAEAQVQEMVPKAEFYDAIASSDDAQSIRDVAGVLGTGQNRMFAWLRGEGILMADNRPYQEYLDRGYFRVVEQTWTDKSGSTHLTTKTLVTGKGLVWLRKRIQNPTGGPVEMRLVQ